MIYLSFLFDGKIWSKREVKANRRIGQFMKIVPGTKNSSKLELGLRLQNKARVSKVLGDKGFKMAMYPINQSLKDKKREPVTSYKNYKEPRRK